MRYRKITPLWEWEGHWEKPGEIHANKLPEIAKYGGPRISEVVDVIKDLAIEHDRLVRGVVEPPRTVLSIFKIPKTPSASKK